MPDAPPYQTHGPLVPGDPLYVCRHADDDLKEGVLAGGLTRSGAGMLTLSSAPAYTGNTVITAGTLAPKNGIASAGGILTVNAPGTLQARSIVNRAIAPAPGAQAIPEPGFTLLLSAGLISLLLLRRPKRSGSKSAGIPAGVVPSHATRRHGCWCSSGTAVSAVHFDLDSGSPEPAFFIRVREITF